MNLLSSVFFVFFFFGLLVCDLGELLKTPVSSPAPGDLVLKALHVFQTCLFPYIDVSARVANLPTERLAPVLVSQLPSRALGNWFGSSGAGVLMRRWCMEEGRFPFNGMPDPTVAYL